MTNANKISYAEAEQLDKRLVSHVVDGSGVMSGVVTDTYELPDGRILINEYGNGGGCWYFKQDL